MIAGLAAIALVAGLAACGGSGSDSSSTTSAAPTTSANHHPSGSGGGGGESRSQPNGEKEESSGSGEGGSPKRAATTPLRVSGGGSGQFRVKGGDNSVQEFGEESSESELEEAATALHDFYVARAEEDWRRACSQLSKAVVGQLEQLGARSKSGDKSCTATLSALTPPLPPSVQRETTAVDAGSLRVEGERGFLIYRGAEDTVYAINMANEGGSWKVGALAAVPLS